MTADNIIYLGDDGDFKKLVLKRLDSIDAWLKDDLLGILEQIVKSTEVKIMAELDEIKVALDEAKTSLVSLSNSISEIATDEAALLAKITDLENQLLNGVVVSVQDMADLRIKATELRDTTQTLADAAKSVADSVTPTP